MASKRRWFWVSRNKTQYLHWNDVVLHVGTKRPSKDEDGDLAIEDDDLEVCLKYFEQFTGITLKAGELKKIELTAREL